MVYRSNEPTRSSITTIRLKEILIIKRPWQLPIGIRCERICEQFTAEAKNEQLRIYPD